MKNTFFFSSILLLCACGNTERAEYVLTDGLLREIQAGDSNTYAVFDASDLENNSPPVSYTELLNAKTLQTPDDNSITVLTEEFSQSGNITLPFARRMFSNDSDGNLILNGVFHGGEHYWLTGENVSEYGGVLLPADLSKLTSPITLSGALKRCENIVCNATINVGQITVTMQPEGTETVKTSYADFETYRFSLGWNLILFDSENTNNNINQELRKGSNKQWIHPAIGVVKFTYEVDYNDTQGATLIGQLTETNISIPSRYRKE